MIPYRDNEVNKQISNLHIFFFYVELEKGQQLGLLFNHPSKDQMFTMLFV
jgi:hypothetical protein